MRSRVVVFFSLALLLAGGAQAAQEYRELDWLDLLTDKDREAMLHLPEIDHGNGPDSQPTSPLRTSDMNMPAVMYSKAVRPELDGAKIKLVGFMVPLELDERGRVVEFFLAPYQGACIHVPPPPPNQIVFVRYPAGVEKADMFALFRFSGVLRTQPIENDLAEASYRLEADGMEINPQE